jgi:tRNA threonylcarbamoyladenosine biosynthesis protein TsaB
MTTAADSLPTIYPALALSCSAQGVSVALATAGAGMRPVIECWHEPDTAGRSDALLAAVDGLLCANRVAPSALRLICAEVGPGPFTALRMTCSVAQGISLATSVPCVGVWSTDALALQAVAGHDAGRYRVLVAVDARMGEVYAATVDIEIAPDGAPGQVLESRACAVGPPDQIWALAGPGRAARSGTGLLIAGNACSLVSGFKERLVGEATDAGWRVEWPAGATVLRADAVLRLGLSRAAAASLEAVTPRYVRNIVALDVSEQAAARARAAGASGA